jgi:hypothetical protein
MHCRFAKVLPPSRVPIYTNLVVEPSIRAPVLDVDSLPQDNLT